MPRKFTAQEKAVWLKLFEGGKSEIWIANNSAHCDVRTVKRGIQEFQGQMERKAARVQLITEALRKHQSDLLATLQEIRSSLAATPGLRSELSWSEEDLRKGGAVPVSGTIRFEGETTRGLLREHTKHDRLWSLVAQREKALIADRDAKAALQRKLLTLLTEGMGYHLASAVGKATPPCVFAETAGSRLFNVAVQRAAGIVNRGDFEDYLNNDMVTGDVKYGGGTVLARVPGAEEACQQDLLEILRKLQQSQEARDVVTENGRLAQATARVRQAVEEALLLGLIPGQCRICRRVGT